MNQYTKTEYKRGGTRPGAGRPKGSITRDSDCITVAQRRAAANMVKEASAALVTTTKEIAEARLAPLLDRLGEKLTENHEQMMEHHKSCLTVLQAHQKAIEVLTEIAQDADTQDLSKDAAKELSKAAAAMDNSIKSYVSQQLELMRLAESLANPKGPNQTNIQLNAAAGSLPTITIKVPE